MKPMLSNGAPPLKTSASGRVLGTFAAVLAWSLSASAMFAQAPEPAAQVATADVSLSPEKNGAQPPQVPAAPLPSNPSEKAVSATSPKLSETPVGFPASRYASLLEKPLFAVATAAPEPVAPVENFASNWFLSSFAKARSKDGTEVYTAFIKSRDLSTRLMLVGEKPEDGVTLLAVEEAPTRAETVAVIRKGTETARVKFDQAAFAAAPPPVAASRPGTPGVPSAPGAPGAPAFPTSAGKVLNATTPKPSIPRPGMSAQSRSGISSPPGAVPPPAQPTGTSGSTESRKRVRPIESAPGTPQ
jgi:hypothetical protein